ncbi:MAG TPA: LysM peptidoglycan-binding domain-containing protein [Clostridiales bacterium]|nr:LysM peptidoglycan-binding domain-containing protein [Clostridiales bacterium]
MRFKDYTWPHNPRVYEIEFRHQVVSHKVPFGTYVLQSLGRTNRVLKGEGEFVGPGAYEEFKKLASVFSSSNSPGLLIHPIWQSAHAYFVALSLKQEPREDYVKYAFEFWECSDIYDTKAKLVRPAAHEKEEKSTEKWHTVVSGDTMWGIAAKNGMSLQELLALNPQMKNPNLIYPGDKVRIA